MDFFWKAFKIILLKFLLFCICDTAIVKASRGDRHKVHKNLLRSCLNINCSSDEKLEEFSRRQPQERLLMGWDCSSECRYEVMWMTVDHFKNEQKPIPQFYGKWPFVRLFGIQEPASVFFSIGNGLSQVYFLIQLRRLVPSTVPMYYLGLFQGIVAVNAWIWSIVFHARDLPWTEKLDYFCAYSIVLCSFMLSLIRAFAVNAYGISRRLAAAFGIGTVLVYLVHIYYLTFVRFDYGYNMKVNITTAVLSFIVWVAWSIRRWKEQPYVWKAIVSVVMVNLCIALEVLDFPPIWWMFDAHSLWHASTIPIAFLWTSFLIDDCLYLHNASLDFKKVV